MNTRKTKNTTMRALARFARAFIDVRERRICTPSFYYGAALMLAFCYTCLFIATGDWPALAKASAAFIAARALCALAPLKRPAPPPQPKPRPYSGHVPCLKCGRAHWMHGPCPPANMRAN